MEQIILYATNFLAFIFVLTILVGIHEYAHYIVAKKMGVKIEIFSIGIGKTLYSKVDKYGTKWCIAMLPLGGYVKMYGDRDISSSAPQDAKNYTDEEKKHTFIHKSPLQRLAIVAAGPISNYILAFIIFLTIYASFGIYDIAPVITRVEENSPAHRAGIKVQDVIKAVNNNEVSSFFDAKALLQTSETPIHLTIKRPGHTDVFEYDIKPELREMTDITGRLRRSKIIGIGADQVIQKKLSILESFSHAWHELYFGTKIVFKSIAGLFTGSVSINDMSGIATIAEISGTVARVSIVSLFMFIASFSVNLAALNLLPIPVLDGGHIFFYIYEIIFKKPINIRVQNTAYKIGAAVIISFMLLVNILDLIHIF